MSGPNNRNQEQIAEMTEPSFGHSEEEGKKGRTTNWRMIEFRPAFSMVEVRFCVVYVRSLRGRLDP
jgi:hypothetical protein